MDHVVELLPPNSSQSLVGEASGAEALLEGPCPVVDDCRSTLLPHPGPVGPEVSLHGSPSPAVLHRPRPDTLSVSHSPSHRSMVLGMADDGLSSTLSWSSRRNCKRARDYFDVTPTQIVGYHNPPVEFIPRLVDPLRLLSGKRQPRPGLVGASCSPSNSSEGEGAEDVFVNHRTQSSVVCCRLAYGR